MAAVGESTPTKPRNCVKTEPKKNLCTRQYVASNRASSHSSLLPTRCRLLKLAPLMPALSAPAPPARALPRVKLATTRKHNSHAQIHRAIHVGNGFRWRQLIALFREL